MKLQVPIDEQVYKKLKIRAEELGFGSVQAYVRFWAKAETTRRTDQPDLNQPNTQALRYLELLLATNKKEPKTIEEALEYLFKEIQRAKGLKYLQELLY